MFGSAAATKPTIDIAVQQGFIQTLESRGLVDWAEKAARVPTDNFVTGMNIALSLYPDWTTEPAGAVEIIAAGGLTQKDLEKIKTLTVDEATLSGVMRIRPISVVSETQNSKLSAGHDIKVLRKIENKMPRLEL